jgi:hypothetical protein
VRLVQGKEGEKRHREGVGQAQRQHDDTMEPELRDAGDFCEPA